MNTQPVEKAAAASVTVASTEHEPKPIVTPTAATVNAAAPTVTTFNLPALPPIPDQANSTAAEAQDTVKVTAVTATPAPISSKPSVVPAADASLDRADARAEVIAPAPVAVMPVAVAPAATPVNLPVHESRIQPAAQPTPAATTPVTEPVSKPTSVVAPPPSVSMPEKPTVSSPVSSLPSPKQGDLLAQPIHPEKPFASRHEESKPETLLPDDENSEHKSDSHG